MFRCQRFIDCPMANREGSALRSLVCVYVRRYGKMCAIGNNNDVSVRRNMTRDLISLILINLLFMWQLFVTIVQEF
jgi:hypothetical protein